MQIQVSLAGATLPAAIIGAPYSYNLAQQLAVTGDKAYAGHGAGVTWSVVSSSLPAGLYLTSDGFIAGTPTAAGSGTVTARATYKGATGEQTYQMVSFTLTVSLAGAFLPGLVDGAAYSYDFTKNLQVTDPNYTPSEVTWALGGGPLPSMLSFNKTTGVLSGTGTAISNAGTSFTVSATYKGISTARAYNLYPVDPYLNSTVMLMHMDNYLDALGRNTLTASGSPSISTSVVRAGSGSMYFNGSSLLQQPYSSKFDFGTGDFTIEFWLFTPIAWGSQPSSAGIISQKRSDSTNGWVIYRDGYYPTKLNARLSNALPYCTTTSTPTQNVWEHWAVTRQGTAVRWFKNGILDATCAIPATASIADSTATLYLGYSQTWGGYLKAYLDDVRVTKGVARYTENFAVPAAELPNQ